MPSKGRELRCLGIDPGIGRTGYGLVSQCGGVLSAAGFGCIETPPNMPFPERLGLLYGEIDEILARWEPDVVAVERLFFGKNITTAEMVWQARGVLLLAVARKGLPLLEPKPNEVKLAVCGTGSAAKSQIQGMVQRILCLRERPRPDDAADALAIGIAGLSMAAFRIRTGGVERGSC